MAREIHLQSELWSNLPETFRRWYEYNTSQEAGPRRGDVLQQVMPPLLKIISADLTNRQREVVTLYYAPRRVTQIRIARTLGISQATVNQHLNGKKRNGKRVGGAMSRIRKRLGNKAESDTGVKTLNILNRLLAHTTNRRKAAKLLSQLVDHDHSPL